VVTIVRLRACAGQSVWGPLGAYGHVVISVCGDPQGAYGHVVVSICGDPLGAYGYVGVMVRGLCVCVFVSLCSLVFVCVFLCFISVLYPPVRPIASLNFFFVANTKLLDTQTHRDTDTLAR